MVLTQRESLHFEVGQCSSAVVSRGTPSDLSSSSVNVKVSEAVCSEEIVIRLERSVD